MKPKPRHKANQKKAKTVLRLPDLEFASQPFWTASPAPTPSVGNRHLLLSE
jgi:hypothetical protein